MSHIGPIKWIWLYILFIRSYIFFMIFNYYVFIVIIVDYVPIVGVNLIMVHEFEDRKAWNVGYINLISNDHIYKESYLHKHVEEYKNIESLNIVPLYVKNFNESSKILRFKY